MAADTTYGNGEFLPWLADRHITPYMRTRDSIHRKNSPFYGPERFASQPESNSYLCPAGQPLNYGGRSDRNRTYSSRKRQVDRVKDAFGTTGIQSIGWKVVCHIGLYSRTGNFIKIFRKTLATKWYSRTAWQTQAFAILRLHNPFQRERGRTSRPREFLIQQGVEHLPGLWYRQVLSSRRLFGDSMSVEV